MKPIFSILAFVCATSLGQAAEPTKLKLHWAKNMLTISGGHLPGGEMEIHYLEAYCRDNSQTTNWGQHTVVGHKTRLISRSNDGSQIHLHCDVNDGVTVEHVITASHDEVDFRLTAHNPTNKRSEAHWAQPCIRVGKFTGTGADATADKYAYIKKSFVYLDGKRAMMPTQGWATEARYIPGAGLGRAGRAARRCQPAPAAPRCAGQRADRLLQRRRLDDLCHRVRAVSGIVPGRDPLSAQRLPAGRPRAGRDVGYHGQNLSRKNDEAALLKRYHKDFPTHKALHRPGEKMIRLSRRGRLDSSAC